MLEISLGSKSVTKGYFGQMNPGLMTSGQVAHRPMGIVGNQLRLNGFEHSCGDDTHEDSVINWVKNIGLCH